MNETSLCLSIVSPRKYRYFQMANGSTQVDVSELNRIPLPSLDLIVRIGKHVRETKAGVSLARQRFTMTVLGIDPAVIDHLLCD